MEGKREMLRHARATLAYRAGKAIRDVPPRFGDFRAGPGSRSVREILAHIGDLMDWALAVSSGGEIWNNSAPLRWERECERFYTALARFDGYLASGQALAAPEETLFQGPVADALTHVGHISMLRRLTGAPVRGENSARARIAIGRVGPGQEKPRREFD